MLQEPNHLNRFSEAHVVCQNPMQPVASEELHPVETGELIVAEGRLQAGFVEPADLPGERTALPLQRADQGLDLGDAQGAREQVRVGARPGARR